MAYISFQPSDYFNTKIYSGTGSSNALTGVGFQPDFTWIKARSTTYSHTLTDAVRGVTKHNASNNSNAEYTSTTEITSFDSDGFTVGTDSGVNNGSHTFASWNWRANGQGSSNTDGSINTTYTSANTTSGFSISTYTGTGANATVGHGLGVAPKVVLIKQTNGTAWWFMYHNDLGTTGKLNLNTTGSNNDLQASYWNSTAPSSSVFSLGTETSVNGSGQNFVAYCFAEKKGFSKFSSFVGNGSADGPFLFCGFKPAFIILKNINDGAKNWEMLDNKRPSSGQNPADDILFPDTSDAESASQTDRLVDFVSNGVKIRGNSAQMNGNGNTHIFMAFAEAPLVSSNGVPAVAR